WIAACTALSPDSTKSSALSGSDGVSWATQAMRALPGRSRSPLSASSSPISAANSDDLPVPLRPTTPTRQPACRARSTPDRSRRSPRRRAKLRKEIIRPFYRAPWLLRVGPGHVRGHFRVRTGDLVHLPGDRAVQAAGIVADGVQVAVGAAGQEAEIGLRAHRLHHLLQLARGTVQVERVRGAHDQVQLAVEVRREGVPAGRDAVG